MNLRRGFLALAAMILGVGFFGAFPQQAQAAAHYTPHAPCIDWLPSGTVWPFGTNGDTHFYICDGSYQNHLNPSGIATSGVKNAAQAQSAVVKTKLLNAGYDLFVFKSPADWNAYGVTTQAPAGAGSLTTTSMSATDHPGPAIAIFEGFCTNPPSGCTTQNYTDTSRLVNHEVGHAVDNIMGMPSLTSNFSTQFDADRTQFNTITNVNWSGLPPVCNSGQNFDKLKCWLNEGNANGSAQFYREFWAYCYAAKQPSGGWPAQAHVILKNYFSTGGMAPSSTVRSCTIVNNIAQTP